MTCSFFARQGVRARLRSLDGVEWDGGVVEELDIGPYADGIEQQFYIWSHTESCDAVRFRSKVAGRAEWVGRLLHLELIHQGARYAADVLCVEAASDGDGAWRCRFEVQGAPVITAPARERHGVDGLGAALLLDALFEEDEPLREA